jgi:hypothetical protein
MADPSPVRNLILWTGATMAMSCLLRFLSSYRDRDQQRVVHDQIIEICLSDIESAKKAIAGGANSIELCVDRSSGGVTPSYGLIKEACRLAIGSNVKVNVLIRPRDGNFIYSDDEFDVMLRDIIIARDAGAHGLSSLLSFSHSLTLSSLCQVSWWGFSAMTKPLTLFVWQSSGRFPIQWTSPSIVLSMFVPLRSLKPSIRSSPWVVIVS